MSEPRSFGRPLRILLVNSLFDGGGADSQTLELAAGLHALGDDVTLLVPERARWVFRAEEREVALSTFPRFGPARFALIGPCARRIRQKGVDIVHAQQGCDIWPVILAARLGGLAPRVVVTRHTLKKPRAASRALLLSRAEVIAVSHAVERVSREHLRGPAQRIHTIHGGMEFSRFVAHRTPEAMAYRNAHGIETEDVVFGVVGSFDRPAGKGQFIFLAAAAQLHPLAPRARFVIVGRGGLEDSLRQRIQSLGLGSVAAVHAFCDDPATIMNALDVLVHPTTSLEAFGLVVIEALASSRPVLVSRQDGLVECFEDGAHGFFLPPGDVPALTSAMGRLYRDAALRRRLGEDGAAHVRQRFSADVMARRTRAVYEDLVGE